VFVEIIEVEGAGVSSCRSRDCQLGNGLARQGTQVQRRVKPVHELVYGNVLAAVADESVVCQTVEHGTRASTYWFLVISHFKSNFWVLTVISSWGVPRWDSGAGAEGGSGEEEGVGKLHRKGRGCRMRRSSEKRLRMDSGG
jgi:hypothetical protein